MRRDVFVFASQTPRSMQQVACFGVCFLSISQSIILTTTSTLFLSFVPSISPLLFVIDRIIWQSLPTPPRHGPLSTIPFSKVSGAIHSNIHSPIPGEPFRCFLYPRSDTVPVTTPNGVYVVLSHQKFLTLSPIPCSASLFSEHYLVDA